MNRDTMIAARPWNTIGGRVYITIGLFLAVILTVVCISALEARDRQSTVGDINLHSDAAVNLLRGGTSWLTSVTLATQYVEHPDPALRAEIERSNADTLQLIDRSSAAEAQLGEAEDVEGLATTKAEAVSLHLLLGAALTAAEEGRTTEARAIMAQGAARFEALTADFAEIADREHEEVTVVSHSSSASANRTLEFLGIVALGSLALAVVASGILIRSVVRPIRSLQRWSVDVARGEQAASAPQTGGAEVESLAATISLMVEKIHAREAALKSSEARWRSLVQNGSDIICAIRKDSQIVYISPAIERVTGRSTDEMTGQRAIEGIHRDDRHIMTDALERLSAGEESVQYQVRIRRADGSWCPLESVGAAMRDDDEDLIVINARDVSDRTEAHNTIVHMAYHDALTALPNRLLFSDRFDVALAQAHRTSQILGVISVDLDRFKTVNDTLGHAAGDELLKAAAARLSGLMRDGDTLARFGGDEFAVLVTNCDSDASAISVVERIVEAFRRPFTIAGKAYAVTTSVGLAIYPTDALDAEKLLQHADAAMYSAKGSGRDNYRQYVPEMTLKGEDWLELASDLRFALDQGRLRVHYQPQVSIDTGEVIGVEALARWTSPERGDVSPLTFIPVAEETGLIVPLGEYVLRVACAEAASWPANDSAPLRLSVNVSYYQVQQPGFVESVRRVLTDTALDPGRLQLEITESIVLQDFGLIRKVASGLAETGVRLSIDDFGSGSTSLRYLKEFPVAELKIDRTFIAELFENPDNKTIASSVIALGHSLHLSVIAEGVETVEQLEFLKGQNCDEFQGFLHSKPMSAEDLHKFVAAQRRVPSRPAAA